MGRRWNIGVCLQMAFDKDVVGCLGCLQAFDYEFLSFAVIDGQVVFINFNERYPTEGS